MPRWPAVPVTVHDMIAPSHGLYGCTYRCMHMCVFVGRSIDRSIERERERERDDKVDDGIGATIDRSGLDRNQTPHTNSVAWLGHVCLGKSRKRRGFSKSRLFDTLNGILKIHS